MRSSKKAAIGQVFIFIVTAITFALILIFGYKAISDFLSKGERVEFFSFKTDLEKAVKDIYTEYGSVKIKEFSLPGRYEKICFINLDTQYPTECDSLINPLACDAWKTARDNLDNTEPGWDKIDQNVFLNPLPATDSPSIKVYKIEVEGGETAGALCLPINRGRFKLRLEGKGDRTKLSAS